MKAVLGLRQTGYLGKPPESSPTERMGQEKGDRLLFHWPRSAGSQTINTDKHLLSGKSHLKSNNQITLRGAGK